MAEILGIVTAFVEPAIEFGKCIIAPIKRQFNYLCCFNSNIKSLRDKAKKLDDARVGLQMRVVAAENNAQVIFPKVEAWLTSASEIEGHLIEIENEIPKVQSGFFTIKSRFSLSKKARKSTEAMKELQKLCNFNQISEATPPPAAISIPLGPMSYEFESRKQIEKGIMEALRGKKVKLMGICGMGGIGKTTMAKRIMNRVKEEHLFDQVVMSVVSQQVDEMKIQQEIAESLGLKLEVGTSFARAHQLRARLQDKKRTLIVLDDIWEKLRLEDLGLTPCESGVEGSCTILLTSREKGVLNAMETQELFAIQTLSESEAWFLFREKAGNCVDDLNLLSIAKQVANECRGLPVALITVGGALKDKNVKPIWDDALQQLKDSNPIDVPNVLKDVYNPLKLSYDFLDSQHERHLFLLCCLFPEDSDIKLEDLTMYCVGLRMFEGIRNLEQVRNRVFALVEMLKNHFLLLDGRGKRDVRMHDVVRDVANYIASKERFIDLNFQTMNWLSDQQSYGDCKWISLFLRKNSELPNLVGLDFPSLGLFMMHGRDWVTFETKDIHFLKGMKGLNVLSFELISFKSLLPSIQLLKNLRTLLLKICTLEGISFVGELLSLEILICNFCNGIEELPVGIGKLNHLKVLDFSYCTSLRTIMPGVMSNLIALEELKMIGSFKGWASASEASKERSKNASLHELQSLSNLTCLEIEVEDYTLAAEEIHLSSRLVKYHIGINYFTIEKNYEKEILISLPREIAIGNWVQFLLRDAEHLILHGDGSKNLDLSQAHNIKSLVFCSCSTIKDLVNPTWRRFDVFPTLESMVLSSLPNLQAICQGPIPKGSISFKNLIHFEAKFLPELETLWKSPNQNISLTNLSSLSITKCGKLLNLFSLTMVNSLLQLEDLSIINCEMMEELFWNDESGIKTHITLPKFKNLCLLFLENLTTFCKGIESIDFPMLISMEIQLCPKLRISIFSSLNYKNLGDGCGDSVDAHDDSFHLFNNLKVCLPIVEKLEVGYLDVTIKDSLLQLKDLIVRDCEMMEQVFLKEEDEYHGQHHLKFPKLKSLHLFYLQNLRMFSKGIERIDFPVLSRMKIIGCPKLRSIVSPMGTCGLDDYTFHLFCSPKVTFGSLEKLEIRCCSKVSNIWCDQIPNGFLTGLKELRVSECDNIRSLFSLAIVRNLANLTSLSIVSCNEMVKVIEDEVEAYKEEIISGTCPSLMSFPRLQDLKLSNLPNLRMFSKGIERIDFLVLSCMQIIECPKLRSIVSPMGACGLDDYTLHLFCSPKVTFGSLEKLEIKHCSKVSNIWCDQIPNGFFTGLKELTISECDNVMSLFSLAIVRNLVNLMSLSIVSCKEMVKVIEDEVEAYKGEIINGTCPTLMLFPKLQELKLSRLPKLGIFCEWSCEIELPVLEKVFIDECSQMEKFALGSLRTPRLIEVRLDGISKSSVELNGILQLHFKDKYNAQ